MTFLRLLRSIFLVCLFVHPVLLLLAGLGSTMTTGKLEGLAAPLATPMTLAFFGLPALVCSLLVIVPAFYALSFVGRRKLAPYAVLAIGAAMLLYLLIARPAPSGAIAGYDQTAQLFAGASLIGWALYAFFTRLEV